MLLPNIEPSAKGTYIWPGVQGATNWYSPSYNPDTKLFYLSYWENRSVYRKGEQEYSPGNRFIGSVPLIDIPGDLGHGGVRALDPKTGARVWDYKLETKPWAGVLSTAGQLVFGGSAKVISSPSTQKLAKKRGGRTWRHHSRRSCYLSGRRQAIRYDFRRKRCVYFCPGAVGTAPSPAPC